MKNLKKLISVVVCLAMMASLLVVSTSAASYGDVDETKGYYASVELLSALGILKGDDNGNFNPDAEIKRSEFAAVVCRALGQESAATSTVSKFPDVSSDHWAVGYIGWAAGKKIVNGYEDGTFRADNAVTLQEAVKMIMAALGYGPIAESENYGGYPYGYLSLAGAYGVTNSISADPEAPASRALVAQLVYNALEAPIVEATNTIYGTAYEIYDGSKGVDYEERTILSQYLDIIKVKANVAENYKTTPSLWKKNAQPQVALDILKIENESDKEDYADDLYATIAGVTSLRTGLKVYEGATKASDFLAYDVNAYLFYNEDDRLELKAIIADSKSIDTLEVTKDIVTADVTGSTVTFEYWEDIDADSRTTEVDIASDAIVYVNGQMIGEISDDEGEAAFEAATEANAVLFVGPRGDYFTKVFITEYTYAMVEEVNLEDEAIEFTDGYLELSKDARGNDKFVYAIYKDGEEIALSDLKADDVLSIVAPGNDIEAAAYLDIYVSSKTLTGTVTGAKSGASNHTYYIDKVQYTTVAANALKVGDEGIFYFTSDGKIYDSKATSSLSDNYAYILKVGADESFGENSYQLRLFTKEGATVTYNVASTLKVTADFGGTIETKTLKTVGNKQDDLFADIDTAADDAEVFAYNVPALLEADTEADAQAKAALRLITYSLSGNEINKISFAAESGDDGKDFNVTDQKSGAILRNATSKFGGYYYDDATVIFYAPVTGSGSSYAVDADDVALLSFASLDEDNEYVAYGFGIEERTLGAALLINELDFAGKSSALAVVKSVATGLNAENEPATTVTVFQGGSTNTYVVDEDVTELDEIAEGDIIQIVVNGAGEISQAEVVYIASTKTLEASDSGDITYVKGWATDMEKGAIVLNTAEWDEGGDDYVFDYEAGCTLALVDETKAGTNSYIKGLTSTSSLKYTTNFASSTKVEYIVVARLVDGEIVDAVEYKLN